MRLIRKDNFIAGIIMVSIFFTGCGTESVTESVYLQEKNSETDVAVQEIASSNDLITYNTDLTHDGIDEILLIDVSAMEEDSMQPAKIIVKTQESQILWQSEIFLPHAGWGSYYLYENEGLPYLIQYIPSNSQGTGYYYYRCFSLDEEGNEVILDEKEIIFDTYPNKADFNFPVEVLMDFASDINHYLDYSFLLISTFDGNLCYSTESHIIKNHEAFQALGIEENVDTEHNLIVFLENYKEYLQNIWVLKQN